MQTLRFMTYNVCNEETCGNLHNFPKALRYSEMASLGLRHGVDVLGVQELNGDSNIRRFLDHLGPDFRRTKEGDIFYRWRGVDGGALIGLLDHGYVSLPPHPNESGRKKSLVWAKLEDKRDGGGEFMIFTTHLTSEYEGSPGDDADNVQRVAEAAVIKKEVPILAQGFPLVVLMGDFNSQWNEAPLQSLLQGAVFPDGGHFYETCPESGTFVNHLMEPGQKLSTRKIDFVLAYPRARIPGDGLGRVVADKVPGENYYPSDHLPVVVDLITSA